MEAEIYCSRCNTPSVVQVEIEIWPIMFMACSLCGVLTIIAQTFWRYDRPVKVVDLGLTKLAENYGYERLPCIDCESCKAERN